MDRRAKRRAAVLTVSFAILFAILGEEFHRRNRSYTGSFSQNDDVQIHPTRVRRTSRSRAAGACGNAPAAFLPDDLSKMLGESDASRSYEDAKETVNDEDEGEEQILTTTKFQRRRLLISRARAFANRNGLMMPTGCDERTGFVKHENYGEGARPKNVFINDGEKKLKKCCESTKRGEDCVSEDDGDGMKKDDMTQAAENIAKRSGFSAKDEKRTQYESCALVGNGGSVFRRKLGAYINNHEIIVRFNMAPIAGFEQYVGNRTDVWFNGHEASKRLCCLGSAKMGNSTKDHVMWFPAKQNVIKSACEKRKIKTKAIGVREIPYYVAKMNKLRYETKRIGLGKKYDNWLQLTTGAHGVFYFLSKCKRVSMYGFGVWKVKNAAGESLDQYAGRKSKVHSGNIFHDWSMEADAWKILHIANVLDVCS